MSDWANKIWYHSTLLGWFLYPFSLIYRGISAIRRKYLLSIQKTYPVPIIVVGNITVGGVGKTPLVIELATQLKNKGLRVGIVSRGYGAQCKTFPYEVQPDNDASWVGDEPLLIAQKTKCPVVISPKRTQAVDYLLQHHGCQIILSDDGLQHYKMGRSIEIAVIDGMRQLGNGFCLPAGPLREPISRLKQVDYVIVNEGQWDNAFAMRCIPEDLIQMTTSKAIAPDKLKGRIAAVAGIGNPQRFYSTLTQLGIKFTSHVYPDHYQFKPSDLKLDADQFIMTEKDAIKCRSFAKDTMYFLPIRAEVEPSFWHALWSHQQLQEYC
ncbi:MAG: tetraacyldisaccharide 4'-kinase [Legionella sp.]|nr:MAG: tetraacyldisaccharide 4'-kinase [Legionella sp.]PJD98690.1 MAG: tetraacyldisaccharide 4'-kinase [Legionella sp.]